MSWLLLVCWMLALAHAYNDAALRSAAEYGHESVVEQLLDAGADVRASELYAWRMASANGHRKVVELL